MAGGIEVPEAAVEAAAGAAASQRVVFVLEGASLEVAKVGKSYELLNADDHAGFLRRHNKDPALYRPDICHQALLAILDSPLNKAGRVAAVYVHTNKNALISVNPGVRLPRTFRRFCGLMAQLLQKLSIRATNGPDKLLKVVKGPVTRLLPPDAHRVGFSRGAGAPVSVAALAGADVLPEGRPLVFVVGAFAHGAIEDAYVDARIAVSAYPLSAAYALGRITNALEARWGIV